MKKRTHFNIARLTIENKQPELVTEKRAIYKWAFYLGTILPDLSITQFIHPHFYAKSSDYVFDKLYKLERKSEKGLLDAMKLGEVVHYLSDYCCFVHKNGSIGKFSEHFLYEKRMNKYVVNNYQKLQRIISKKFIVDESSVEILEQIKIKLADYSMMVPSFDLDIMKSVELSSIIYYGILQKHGYQTEIATEFNVFIDCKG